MTALTNYTENNLINHIFRTASFTKPTTLYIGLITTLTDGEAGTVIEVTGGSYTRIARNPLDANWAASITDGTTSNTAVITFPAATANWGTVNAFGIWDNATAGNLLIYSSLTAPRTITEGTTPSFGVGALTFQIDN